jgi:hypothetical protein
MQLNATGNWVYVTFSIYALHSSKRELHLPKKELHSVVMHYTLSCMVHKVLMSHFAKFNQMQQVTGYICIAFSGYALHSPIYGA